MEELSICLGATLQCSPGTYPGQDHPLAPALLPRNCMEGKEGVFAGFDAPVTGGTYKNVKFCPSWWAAGDKEAYEPLLLGFSRVWHQHTKGGCRNGWHTRW